ncbi:MAG: hypothetical protein R3254_00945, partial [Thiomicrorhabdus sp.]|nr:hypothetical protein [Thiomicrorhabdus sp.]
STAWNISTGSEYSSLSTVGFDTSCTDVFASPDGKYLYAMGNQTDTLYQLTLNKETIELFSGKPRKVKYSKGKATLSIVDKFQQLSDRQIGDSTNIKVFSEELPSEIAWAAVTSYGGYSSIAGSNNPDIDYDAFAAWAGVFSGDNVLMSANFDGQKCTEVLRKISRSTGSAIFIKENRISFHRYTIVDTDITSLGNSEIINMNLEFDSNEIVNKQYVGAAWSTESDYHTITVYDEDTTSVNSFGLKESNFKDENLYYINSASALNFAQRITFTQAEPQDKLVVETAMNGMLRQIGETISVVDNQLSIAGGYRVMNYEIDMDKGKVTFGADRTQLVNAFILDVTSLDGTEILT